MTPTTEELKELEQRLLGMINDIRQGALPNPGSEKEQWIEDLVTVRTMVGQIVDSETPPKPL